MLSQMNASLPMACLLRLRSAELTGICWSKFSEAQLQGLWVACYCQQGSAQLETICGSIEGGSRNVYDVDSLAIKQTAMYGELGFLSTLQGVKLGKSLQRGRERWMLQQAS